MNVLKYIYQYNEYLVKGKQSGLVYMITQGRELWSYPMYLFRDFNYDKDSLLNRHACRLLRDHNTLGQLNREDFRGRNIYGDVVYREGFMQTMVENCYDPNRKDEYGLVKCNLVQYMQDCIVYELPDSDADFKEHDGKMEALMKYPKEGAWEKVESFDRSSPKDWKLAFLLGYYLRKMYEKYVAETGAMPRCWVDHFGMALYNADNDCESLFYKKIKAEKYYGHEDFAQTCKEIYDETRGQSHRNTRW